MRPYVLLGPVLLSRGLFRPSGWRRFGRDKLRLRYSGPLLRGVTRCIKPLEATTYQLMKKEKPKRSYLLKAT